uniref:DNA topoisomerase (ATP-hydrolyzing) n=1 Tax=viral metagenome TaxID=1070528 RepID=A0A6C0E1U2_9ZZZZ
MQKKQSKTIEDTYKKVSGREHVLLRPNMYIGSPNKQLEEMWVFQESSSDNKPQVTKKMIEYVPGFLKIFDEILTNATDAAARDETVNTIKVDIDKGSGEITVMNNGKSVPVALHKEHNIYVPELIFGNLLSGSNYDDKDVRTGSGVNGLGAKLTNIFSKKFVVETLDSERGLKFLQEYTNNMTSKSAPKVTKNSGKSYTKITFIPDYGRFGMKGLEEDTILLLTKRVYDCIACTSKNVSIYYNGKKLIGKGLQDYVRYFFSDSQLYYDSTVTKINGKEELWEYVVVPWDKFEQVSFVNGNSTYSGGKHVDHVLNQVTKELKGMLESKKRLKDIKPSLIKDRIFLFLKSVVVNPQFSSQTKEYLTTQSKDFGCRVEVSEKYIDKLWKSKIIEEIVDFCKLKEAIDLAKTTDGKKKSKIYIPKLEDALWAGTGKSTECTLILTEGDSAKTFALWGRNAIEKGAEKYGTWPLRGKVLNVRDATVQQLMNNEEINNLKQILGLKQGMDYKDVSELRYGKVIVLTDADVDGNHIKGLLINFFHASWPSLVKLNFIQTLRTPILKAIKGKQVYEFFNEQDYHKWMKTTSTTNFNIKYYKGLGTSTKQDAQNTFRKIEDMMVGYYYKDSKCDDAILLAFEKDKNVKTEGDIKCSDKRKKWLSTYNKDLYVDMKQQEVSYQEFVHKELIHFSIYDNLRSIPSFCDGLKPSQRKILYFMLKKSMSKPIKVAQLSGYVSAETCYHHGEASLQQAIIGMAQDFVGSNNINLLYPDGNFGSRLCNKDAASPRYIFTRLSDITTSIFNPHDTPLLTSKTDDGITVEPEWYIPVIPIVLVNGCEGIGTGYSTYIPPHNPKDIIANIKRILDGKSPLDMKPYFKGFGGDVKDLGKGSYMTSGKWQRTGDAQITITELPVGTWVTPYKEFLESLVEGGGGGGKKDQPKTKKKDAIVLKDVRNQTKDENNEIEFVLDFKSKSDVDKLIGFDILEKELKLNKMFNTNNMYLFDDKCIPTRYANTTDILLDFCDLRLEYYQKRKEHIIEQTQHELNVLQSKARFIDEYINEVIHINRKSKEYIIKVLEERKYYKIEESFDYLINLPIISLTNEKIKVLKDQVTTKEKMLAEIKNKTEKDLWLDDLAVLNKLL